MTKDEGNAADDRFFSNLLRSDPAYDVLQTFLWMRRLNSFPASFFTHFANANLEMAHRYSHVDVLQAHVGV